MPWKRLALDLRSLADSVALMGNEPGDNRPPAKDGGQETPEPIIGDKVPLPISLRALVLEEKYPLGDLLQILTSMTLCELKDPSTGEVVIGLTDTWPPIADVKENCRIAIDILRHLSERIRYETAADGAYTPPQYHPPRFTNAEERQKLVSGMNTAADFFYAIPGTAAEEAAARQSWSTVSQLASLTGHHKGTITRAADRGAFVSHGHGRKRRIDLDSFMRWYYARQNSGPENDREVENKLRQVSVDQSPRTRS